MGMSDKGDLRTASDREACGLNVADRRQQPVRLPPSMAASETCRTFKSNRTSPA